MEAERRRLALTPEDEFEELVDIYAGKGLSPGLARQVATELWAKDALAAQLDAEYGIPADAPPVSPLALGVQIRARLHGRLAAAAAAAADQRAGCTRDVVFLLVGIALAKRRSRRAFGPRQSRFAVARTLAIGLGSMLISLLAGSLLSF